MLKQGSKGDDVKTLQTRLNQLGFSCGAADGIFGSKTEAAVKAFQKSRGLVADGIVGPKTSALLWTPAYTGKWTHIIDHHSGAEEKNTAQIRNYHVNSRGWQDIGYNFVIERDGKVVAGRSLSIKGAHCIEYNHCGIGICMIGNMDKRLPTDAQYSALIDLHAKLCKQYNIPVKNILGHREASPTACPGKNVNMDKVRVDVEKKLTPRTGQAKPKPAPATFSKIARQIVVRVNGKPVSAVGYIINGTTYLQASYVAGLFGGKVTGHGDYIDIKTKV